ncbi:MULTISPECIES: hypothetical protein [unclassified Streptomyces]|uniref:hypothetical protein n=1 Tax=unclassified Streptomyces TaxID=2593676 RepID=UPI002001DFBC|nr:MULTISPECIES: hypothetical protein [unclassified Streptomyces]
MLDAYVLEAPVAMIGLFWITEKSVYVGAEPAGNGRGVRLTPEGLEAVGTDQKGFWAWRDVRAVTVHDVQVRSSTRWLVNSVMDTVLDVATGGGEAPPAFELHVATDEEKAELTVYTAAVGGYVQSEYELSLDLLNRFVEGTADVSRLLEWGSAEGDGITPWRAAREALLRSWATTA